MLQDTESKETISSLIDGSAFESADGIMDVVSTVWRTELFQLNEHPISVSQIVIALLVLILGLALARWVSVRVGKRILPRMKVNQSASNAIQSIIYYMMLMIAILLSLQIAGVPLTALAFFGGAIALGFGFGSQNVINNFISGLILLIERPIRIGDLVTINGEQGVIAAIGARATKLESYLGSTFIVPNSIILENSVTNWNMPTSTVKSIISVGAAYGSDTSKVREILESVIKDHPTVSKSAENKVMFVNFGDSSLDFEIHCRIHPKNVLEAKSFESDIRFKIDEEFRKHGIEIPFPQREVHVKSG
ncbi:MAG: mechanosensitive ion channel, partial [Phycisphaerales bacterium]|nr:mechanosensitive ion channel [Phycisphaerales bacterium]